METILLVTDFSEAALKAGKYAAALTHQLPVSRLVLYHSYDIPVATEVPMANLESDSILYERSMQNLNTLKDVLAPLATDKVRIECLADAKPLITAVKDVPLKEKAGLLVMGVTGESRIKEEILGSQAVMAAKQTETPLLVVPFEAEIEWVDRVVFAWDMKDTRETFPETVFKNFIHALKAELLVLNIDHEEKHFSAGTIEEQKLLYGLLEQENPQYFYNDHPDAAGGIITFAEKQQAQLVIIIQKKQGFPHKLFKENIAKKLAFHIHIPVLILPKKTQ